MNKEERKEGRKEGSKIRTIRKETFFFPFLCLRT
jgi:hypothetical protein